MHLELSQFTCLVTKSLIGLQNCGISFNALDRANLYNFLTDQFVHIHKAQQILRMKRMYSDPTLELSNVSLI